MAVILYSKNSMFIFRILVLLHHVVFAFDINIILKGKGADGSSLFT